ncbi:MAG: transglycosylase domain-containing protein [Mucilaginibacter sp.]|uniref:transglycosylase domain-containing protein n=1 Tax=Mucilaginibacter sp. L3T2-6 TaxID=3062491 RepID=UPI002676BB72|nr:transglycosylase domain-containing protein [Mucilaginibacter sp. L3T2-6]MDO3640450.1 transglycosylase domain-containing protein [Mucilaginibacter sp. L3T2-6]MDV6213211.1 transglycosylase domain-containing protein [Mucilaginibacter sp. L3T2-6]
MIIKLRPEDIRRYNWYIWKTLIAFVALFILLLVVTYFGLFGPLPSFRAIENPKSNQASEVLAADKSVLGTYYVQNRSSVNYSQLSPNVVNALIATEDVRFKEHSGIDFQRLPGIVFFTMIGKKQGASTITQQLAKNLFTDVPSRNPFVRFTQKLKEWIIAIRLERRYTKEEIVTMYLNTVSFGAYNTFGIKSAARTYFNVTPDKLTPDQAALLVGMLKGTVYYSPIRHPDRALARRNTILDLMDKQGFLSGGQAAELKAKPIGLNFSLTTHNDGPAPYFRAVLKQEIQKIFKDQNITKSDGTPYDLDRDGLKIYTTIDATMQQYAEEAQQEYMKKLQVEFDNQWKGVNRARSIKNYKLLLDQGMFRSDRYKQLQLQGKSEEEIRENFNTPDTVNLFTWHGDIDTLMKPIDSIVYTKMTLRNALMSMDPTTGYVKAWVGGTNFEHFKYDQVKLGTRQVGSTAKPFTYAVAIENGFSPCQEVDNVPVTITGYGSEPWTPKQSMSDYLPGAITLRKALGYSQNYVAAYVMNEVKPVPVMELIKKMGITSDVPPYPSICLGTFNASVYDMTGAYSVFANHGTWTEPTYILRIEDKNGNVIYTHTPKVVQAMDAQTAYVMTSMLKGVIEDGTGSRLRYRYGFNNPVGGKTGTTQDNSDGWFMGITPQLVTGVWTACEDRDIHFRSTRLGEGANSALPIFAGFMKRVYNNPALGIKRNVDFDAPKGGVSIVLDCSQYQQQQQGTTEVDKRLGF